jgi:hypothetical protein
MKSFNFLLIFSLLFSSCIKEDHFGKSSHAEIKTFVIQGQVGNTTINQDSLTIVIPVPETTIDFSFKPTEITTSNFASVSPSVDQVQDFSSPVSYEVTAEDGSIQVYLVTVKRVGSQIQLENSSFEDWYIQTVLGNSFDQPGLDENTTIWGTANRGLALGGASANTTKQLNGDSSYVRMESVAAPALVRIAAATIFTGKFTESFPSISDPRSNITLGTSFSGRPLSFSFYYTYQPGSSNEDENGQALAYGDQCDIYLFLENRDGAQVKRVGTAWFRSGTAVTQWTKQEIPVKYGPLDATDPWYSFAQPIDGEVWGDGTEVVTHITILATSSFEGDFFKGAIGSTLELDNIELIY